MSQSDRASHNGFTARLKGWTKGCISVEDKSSFSYHVAAGKTISAYNGVAVIRKSKATSRSSFPSTSSRHLISSGFIFSFGFANKLLLAPNKCFIKYSCPLAELETRFDRQTNKDLGKFSGASGSSIANFNFPSFNCSTTS